MNHDAFEKEMIDIVNRNAEEVPEVTVQKRPLVNKNDGRILARGLRRTLLALFTVMQFAISVMGFVAVATVHGYLAVIVFFASILSAVITFTLLYAQGITYTMRKESQGARK